MSGNVSVGRNQVVAEGSMGRRCDRRGSKTILSSSSVIPDAHDRAPMICCVPVVLRMWPRRRRADPTSAKRKAQSASTRNFANHRIEETVGGGIRPSAWGPSPSAVISGSPDGEDVNERHQSRVGASTRPHATVVDVINLRLRPAAGDDAASATNIQERPH